MNGLTNVLNLVFKKTSIFSRVKTINFLQLNGAQKVSWIRWFIDFFLLMPFVFEGFVYHLSLKIFKKKSPKFCTVTAPLFRLIFDNRSIRLRTVYQHRGQVRALHQLYHPETNRDLEDSFGKIIGDWFLNVRNAVAVRNRQRIVEAIVIREIMSLQRITGREDFVALSIACGSAEAMIRAAERLKKIGVRLKLVLYDINKDALELARKITEKYNIENIEFIHANANKLTYELSIREIVPDICEIVGLLDYFDHKATVRILQRVHSVLNRNGKVLISNIRPNFEMFFVSFTLDWRMKYRWIKDHWGKPGLHRILTDSGFSCEGVFIDRSKVYSILLGRKFLEENTSIEFTKFTNCKA